MQRATLWAASVLLICGCIAIPSAAEDAKPDPGPAEPGVIKGTATTTDGKPLKTFGGSISGYSAKSGQTQNLAIDGADGKYRTDVGPGQFAARAWTDVDYNGHNYRIDLHPADGKGGLTKQDTKPGVIKNWVWKLDGYRPGGDPRSDDRFYSHYGGSVNLNPEGHGVLYWSGIKKDYQHKPEPPIPADATVELTLTPDGPLIDGSAGKPFVIKLKCKSIKGYMDRITRGIPIGKYKATAVAKLADGSSKKLKVTPFYSFKESDAPDPAESAEVEFIQSKPSSENVNCVDEINVHVMF